MEEPHLMALIKEDSKLHPKSKISEIHKRVDDLDIKYLRKIVYKMYNLGEIDKEGGKKNMVYFLVNKKKYSVISYLWGSICFFILEMKIKFYNL